MTNLEYFGLAFGVSHEVLNRDLPDFSVSMMKEFYQLSTSISIRINEEDSRALCWLMSWMNF